MGTLNAFYVRTDTDDARVTAAIRARFPSADIEAGAPFCGVTLPDEAFEAPERDLLELSAQLKTDVVWLSFQSVVDAFQFHHWRAGEQLRSLVYGCMDERTWERAEGTPEPWERAVFFDEERLKHALEYLDTGDDKQRIERIWRDAEIQPGRTEPDLDARECAWKVAEHFHFPGWNL
jgi:hypothetical protein